MITVEVDKYKLCFSSEELIDLKEDLKGLIKDSVRSDNALGYGSTEDFILANLPALASLMKALKCIEDKDELPF